MLVPHLPPEFDYSQGLPLFLDGDNFQWLRPNIWMAALTYLFHISCPIFEKYPFDSMFNLCPEPITFLHLHYCYPPLNCSHLVLWLLLWLPPWLPASTFALLSLLTKKLDCSWWKHSQSLRLLWSNSALPPPIPPPLLCYMWGSPWSAPTTLFSLWALLSSDFPSLAPFRPPWPHGCALQKPGMFLPQAEQWFLLPPPWLLHS